MTSINKAHAPVVPQTTKTDTAQKTPPTAPAEAPKAGWTAKSSPAPRPQATAAAAPIMPPVTGTAPFIAPQGMVQMARAARNPAAQAGVLGMIAKHRPNL